jgi:hypothetical protein
MSQVSRYFAQSGGYYQIRFFGSHEIPHKLARNL